MKKAVLVISSHVARGSVGNRACVFALEVLGHPVWAVPTIVLPFHPGHGAATRIVSGNEEFQNLLNDLLASPWIGELGAILTGYMASGEQAMAVTDFITKVKRQNNEIVHVCDPVLGDTNQDGQGELYVNESTAAAIRDHLALHADLITPNRFELSYLSGSNVESVDDAREAALKLPNSMTLITSIPGYMKGNIGNLYVDGHRSIFAEHKKLDNPPNGPGDLTAALFLSHRLSGMEGEKALHQTSASVFEIIAASTKRNADELMLETDAQSIIKPRAMVQVRNLI